MKITGHFKKYEDAFKALTKLKTQGFKDSYIPGDYFGLNQNGEIDIPGPADATTLSNLVLNSGDDTDNPPSPLSAASPMVSGMAGFEEITENEYKIVVKAEDKDHDIIHNLIANSGGTVAVDTPADASRDDNPTTSALSYDHH